MSRFEFQNLYSNLENPFEDLRVSTEAAEFQSQQLQQSTATSLQKMQEMGMFNVQALANQQQLGAQKIAADIGSQEGRARELSIQGAREARQLETGAKMKVASGAYEADIRLIHKKLPVIAYELVSGDVRACVGFILTTTALNSCARGVFCDGDWCALIVFDTCINEVAKFGCLNGNDFNLVPIWS